MNKLKVLNDFKSGKNGNALEWHDAYTNYKFVLKPKDIISISGDRNAVYIKMKAPMDFNFGGQKQYKKGEIIPCMTCDKFVQLTIVHAEETRKN